MNEVPKRLKTGDTDYSSNNNVIATSSSKKRTIDEEGNWSDKIRASDSLMQDNNTRRSYNITAPKRGGRRTHRNKLRKKRRKTNRRKSNRRR
jgi:hypothetical protein